MIALCLLLAWSPEEIERQISEQPQIQELTRSATHVAWTEILADPTRHDRFSAVWILPSNPGKRASMPRRVTARAGDGREDNPAFSPDGKTLAFVSDADGQTAIYLWNIASGVAKRLARPAAAVSHLQFSRDNQHIAFLASAQTAFVGAVEALPADRYEVVDAEPPQRLARVDVATGEWHWLTPEDTYVYDFDEAPNGICWVGTTSHGSGIGNYWIAELSLIDANGVRPLWKAPRQLATPRFSPDGMRVAVLHGLMSDEGANGGDLTVIALKDRIPHVLPRALSSTATWLAWRGVDELLFAGVAEGDSFVASQKLDAKKETLLWRGSETISGNYGVGLAVASGVQKTDDTAVIRSSFTQPPRVEIGRVGAWKPLPTRAPNFAASWGEAQRITWKTELGETQGWLVPPLHLTKSQSPLVTIVHGGPAGAKTNVWDRRWVGLLASQGYFVFLPNPRGSIGQGEAFTEANIKDFGGGDWRDIQAGIDAVLHQTPTDPERLGIVGWSYGGFMAMFAPTQTPRFKAAVTGAGISNWQSYYGQNHISTWMIPYFGASVYDTPAPYARVSAVGFAKKARTPTLLLCGERDAEVPPAQSYEWWNALRSQGVPAKLVVYPGEGHHFRSRDHWDDAALRSLAWLNQYLR